MCRHFAWIGHARTLHDLFFAPRYGLLQQARVPRWQRAGLVNKDGFGVGWFPLGHGTTERYRTAIPIWDDGIFPSLAREVVASCVLGAVRAASPGMPIEENANAPFSNGRYLLSLNGHLNVDSARSLLDGDREPESACDAALLATLLWQRLDVRPELTDAVIGLLRDIGELDPGACLNMLATDGAQIVATAWGETLCYQKKAGGILVASEPHDEDDGWMRVSDRTLVIADAAGVETHSLSSAGAPSATASGTAAATGVPPHVTTGSPPRLAETLSP